MLNSIISCPWQPRIWGLHLILRKQDYNLLVQHQKLMLEHFGHKETAVLPEDVIHCLLLGVSTLFCFPTPSVVITIDH